MNSVFNTLKKYSETILIALFGVSALFALLYYVGTFPDAFMPVVGHLLVMLFHIGLLCAVPVLILLKKNDLAKNTFLAFGVYWMISTVMEYLSSTGRMYNGIHGLRIASAVFEFVIALAILTAFVFFFLAKTKNSKLYKNVTVFILLGIFAFFFIAFILNIVWYSIRKAHWSVFINVLCEYIFMPAAMIFGLLYFDYLEFDMPESITLIKKKKPVVEQSKVDSAEGLEENEKNEIAEPIAEENTEAEQLADGADTGESAEPQPAGGEDASENTDVSSDFAGEAIKVEGEMSDEE